MTGSRSRKPDLLTYCSTFLAAGSDTTRSLLAGMALALAEHPDQLRKLKENPGLLDGAIEESLRWTTPARGFLRTAVVDTQVRGVDIKAGQRVYLLYDAGNRDAEVFADPWAYDIERPNASAHLGFGYGPHLCIAAHLARLEARELYRALLNAFGKIEVSGRGDRDQAAAAQRLGARAADASPDTSVPIPAARSGTQSARPVNLWVDGPGSVRGRRPRRLPPDPCAGACRGCSPSGRSGSARRVRRGPR